MRILILEDMEPRITWLRRVLPDAALCWVKSVPEFDQLWARDRAFGLVILDHDLRPEHYGAGSEMASGWNGMAAARSIAESGVEAGTSVLVWSMNPIGAPRMERVLREAGVPVSRHAFALPGLAEVLATYASDRGNVR